MFYSMTGYGTGQATSKKMEVLCEIKSVNNRFVDISFRGYSLPNDLEEYIKNQLKKKFLRGCLLYTSPSPRDGLLSRMPSSA